MMNYGESDGRSLLDRMTAAEDAEQQTFNDDQVTAMIEIFIPKFVETCPGLAGAGMKCRVTRDADGWAIRIDKRATI